MQRKCHRCDRLFTPDSHSTWCPDCRAGKPIQKKRTVAEVRAEIKAKRDAEEAKKYKYERYCICCGKKFYTNKANRVICSDYECEEKVRIERLQTNRARYRANAKQKRAKNKGV
jgi:hypothetical protein|nr:MAG TPA: zinc-ribbon protein [Caudoviricetes sp.]DAU56715.1 MAG TPA: zinc-ribbon protein [Caudoviricetes sp.]